MVLDTGASTVVTPGGALPIRAGSTAVLVKVRLFNWFILISATLTASSRGKLMLVGIHPNERRLHQRKGHDQDDQERDHHLDQGHAFFIEYYSLRHSMPPLLVAIGAITMQSYAAPKFLEVT